MPKLEGEHVTIETCPHNEARLHVAFKHPRERPSAFPLCWSPEALTQLGQAILEWEKVTSNAN